jgi:hypothetical protein
LEGVNGKVTSFYFYNFDVAENYHRLLTLIAEWQPDAKAILAHRDLPRIRCSYCGIESRRPLKWIRSRRTFIRDSHAGWSRGHPVPISTKSASWINSKAVRRSPDRAHIQHTRP